MKKGKILLWTTCLVLFAAIFAGCGSGSGTGGHDQHGGMPNPNPEVLERGQAVLTTDPSPPKAGTPTNVQLKLNGLKQPKETKVKLQFTKKGEERVEKDEKGFPIMSGNETQSDGAGTYTTTYTFPEAGTYVIVFHIDLPDLHQMFEQEVEVNP